MYSGTRFDSGLSRSTGIAPVQARRCAILVLSRRPAEKIIIGHNITVTLVAVDRGGKVRLGISAPDSVPVYRQELPPVAVDRIKAIAEARS